MELYSTLSGIFTVVTFVTFAGIVRWAWGARRRDVFAEAAKAPFALPDEPVGEHAERTEFGP
jgi:cytochrome c oxidase cbb3-type subunit 4